MCVVVDLGAGDGSAALRRARREPAALVVAIDPVAEHLQRASRAAARRPSRGGLPNALFLAGSAEELPWLLAGKVFEVVVALPWGALLRAVALPEPEMVERLVALLRPGGRLTLLLSVAPGDVASGLGPLDADGARRLAATYRALGLECRELRAATRADVVELSAGWGRRLRIPERRTAYLLRFSRRHPLAGRPL